VEGSWAGTPCQRKTPILPYCPHRTPTGRPTGPSAHAPRPGTPGDMQRDLTRLHLPPPPPPSPVKAAPCTVSIAALLRFVRLCHRHVTDCRHLRLLCLLRPHRDSTAAVACPHSAVAVAFVVTTALCHGFRVRVTSFRCRRSTPPCSCWSRPTGRALPPSQAQPPDRGGGRGLCDAAEPQGGAIRLGGVRRHEQPGRQAGQFGDGRGPIHTARARTLQLDISACDDLSFRRKRMPLPAWGSTLPTTVNTGR
jgi:hypothetical protein